MMVSILILRHTKVDTTTVYKVIFDLAIFDHFFALAHMPTVLLHLKFAQTRLCFVPNITKGEIHVLPFTHRHVKKSSRQNWGQDFSAYSKCLVTIFQSHWTSE